MQGEEGPEVPVGVNKEFDVDGGDRDEEMNDNENDDENENDNNNNENENENENENKAEPTSDNDDNENDNESTCEANQNNDEGHNNGDDDPLPEGTPHPEDDRLWLYHYESTNSTQDQAKRIAEHLSSLSSSLSSSSSSLLPSPPTSFCVTASMQTKGRGTSGRHWMGAPGNVFVTMGVPTRTWMTTLLRDRKIPLTLLPLTIGTLVAELVQSELDHCGGTNANTDTDTNTDSAAAAAAAAANAAVVTAKWPNDVLVDGKKISGTLIESSPNGDWFLIGIGINVAHAPTVPTTGTDYGRAAVSLREYGCCGSKDDDDDDDDGQKSSRARALGVKLALGFHRWMQANTDGDNDNHNGNHNHTQRATAESIVEGWTKWLDKDAEWTIRNDGGPPGAGRRPKVVRLLDVLPDGRIRVRNKDTGAEEILVSDYFV